jgi:hypothetical protein
VTKQPTKYQGYTWQRRFGMEPNQTSGYIWQSSQTKHQAGVHVTKQIWKETIPNIRLHVTKQPNQTSGRCTREKADLERSQTKRQPNQRSGKHVTTVIWRCVQIKHLVTCYKDILVKSQI